MHKGLNSHYHTLPEILRGVDFSVNQVDLINVSLKKSLTTLAYGQGPNFLTIVLLGFIALSPLFLSYHPMEASQIDEAQEDFFSFPFLSSSVYSTSSIRDDRTFYENTSIVMAPVSENELDEDQDEDIPVPEEFPDNEDYPLYQDLATYFEGDSYTDIYMHNDFRQLGSQLYIPPFLPDRARAQAGAISDPSYWSHSLSAKRTHPRAKFQRMKEALYWKVEQLYKAGTTHPLYPHRSVRPGTLAGKGSFTLEERIENARTDPFHLDDFTSSLLDPFVLQNALEDILENTEGWYPEAYIDQDFLEEAFLEHDIDYRYNQIVPDERPSSYLAVDGHSVLGPLLKKPPRSSHTNTTDQARELLFFDPPDEPLFEYVDSDDPLSLVDSLPVAAAERSSLSHNFDYGTYVGIGDLEPEVQAHIFSGESKKDLEILNAVTGSNYGKPADAQFFDFLLETRGLFAVFPSRELLYCADIARLNEDLFSELAGLEAQIVALREVFEGEEDLDFSIETLPLVWDFKKTSWMVFNYSSNRWLRVSDFLSWAEQRSSFLLSEVIVPKGSSNLFHKTKDLFKNLSRFRYSFFVGVVNRLSFNADKLLEFLSHNIWYRFVLVYPIRFFLHFIRSAFSHLRGSRSIKKEYSPFLSFVEYLILVPLLQVLSRDFKEAAIDNTVYGDLFPYEQQIEELLEPAYGLPLYPYWLRLGVFNTMDYIDAVDHYDPADPTWLSRAYELPAEEFEPLLPVTDIDFVRSYYLDTPREFKRLVQKYKLEAMYIYPPEQETRIMARMHDNISMPVSRDHFFVRDAKMIDPLKVNRVLLKIVGYDFADYNIFRHVTNDQVKAILKEQIFKKDHIIERDLTAKYTAEEKRRARKKTARLRIRIAQMIQANVFTPVGRLETRFIHSHDHKPYVRLKYIDTPPKKIPKRRRIFRRF